VVAAGRADAHSTMTSLLVQSTNDMLDAAEEHLAAVANPMPVTVFLVLILVTAAAMATIGYECGLGARCACSACSSCRLLLAVRHPAGVRHRPPADRDREGPRSDPDAAQAELLRRVRGRCRRSRDS
jgi:hypothetical protein